MSQPEGYGNLFCAITCLTALIPKHVFLHVRILSKSPKDNMLSQTDLVLQSGDSVEDLLKSMMNIS